MSQSIRVPLPAAAMKFRPDSQDFLEVVNVLYGNEYRLPDRLEGVVIDVGANIGSFALAALARGADSVLCVEPCRENFELLTENTRPYGDRVDRRLAAVWSPGQRVVPVDCPTWHTSMGRVHNDGVVRARAVTLDRLIDPHREVELLKLDCEGAEWPALYTCRLLHRVRRVAAELHPTIRVDGYECDPAALAKHLKRIGFVVEWAPGECNGLLFARREAA